MTPTALETAPHVHGLRAVALENELLRVVVLPGSGGKIWQIRYRPLNEDLLWNRHGLAPGEHPLGANSDDLWAGGWDELFPTDEAALWEGLELPDHGELWTGRWQDSPMTEGGSRGLKLTFQTPLTQFRVEKTLLLDPGAARLRVRYRLENQSERELPFLFKLHPAFAVSGNHRLDLPPMQIDLEPDFQGTLEGARSAFAWPYAPMPDGDLDLRQIPGPESGAVRFFYGHGLTEGWCALTNRSNGLAAALSFDPAVFPSFWLFATHGGWNGHNVAVLEPATGWPFRLQDLVDGGRAHWLKPGQTLETEVLFAVAQGLESVGGVTAEGRILPGA